MTPPPLPGLLLHEEGAAAGGVDVLLLVLEFLLGLVHLGGGGGHLLHDLLEVGLKLLDLLAGVADGDLELGALVVRLGGDPLILGVLVVQSVDVEL